MCVCIPKENSPENVLQPTENISTDLIGEGDVIQCPFLCYTF